jgi:hypothetical protein
VAPRSASPAAPIRRDDRIAEPLDRRADGNARRTRQIDPQQKFPFSGFVATREVGWMRRDGVALILTILVPVIAFAILSVTFSGQPPWPAERGGVSTAARR